MMMLREIMEKVSAGMTKAEAAEIVESQVQEIIALGYDTPEEARRRVLQNIGYFAGYYSASIQDKTYDLFETEHPIFGRTHPTPAEALRRGMELGAKARKSG